MIPSTLLVSLSKVFQRQDQRMIRLAKDQATLSAQNRALSSRLEQLEVTNRSLVSAIDRLADGVRRLQEARPRTPSRHPGPGVVRPLN